MSGSVVALGVLLLMGALGLAIGVTALGDPRAATSATASGLGIGAGVWAFITLVDGGRGWWWRSRADAGAQGREPSDAKTG